MGEFTPITTQEQFDEMIKSRLERERTSTMKQYADYDSLKTANATLQKSLEEASKGKEDLTKQIADLNSQISGLKTEELKTKVAVSVGLPLEMRSRLTGSTEDEIKADAEALMKFVAPKQMPLKSNEPQAASSEEAAYKKMLSEIFSER